MAGMTKKHFIALADAVRGLLEAEVWGGQKVYCPHCQDRPGYDGLGRTCKTCNGTGVEKERAVVLALFEEPQKERIVSELADFCASQSPRFDRERWLRYVNGECGRDGGVVGTNGRGKTEVAK